MTLHGIDVSKWNDKINWQTVAGAGVKFAFVRAGVGAAIGQFGVTLAYRYAEPRSIAVYDYTNVIFTALFGFVFFAQVPDLLSVAGFVVILAAAFWLRWAAGDREARRGASASQGKMV